MKKTKSPATVSLPLAHAPVDPRLYARMSRRLKAILTAAAADSKLQGRISRILARAAAGEFSTLAAGRVSLRALSEASAIEPRKLYNTLYRLRIVTVREKLAAGLKAFFASVTTAEAHLLLSVILGEQLHRAARPAGKTDRLPYGYGHLYICLLEPQFDSGRFKIGWTGSPAERLGNFLTSTPFSDHLQHWPCLRQWELTARAFITRDCEHIREEIYRTRDLRALLARAALFFVEMPDPRKITPTTKV